MKKPFSRRRFLKAGSLSVAGVIATYTSPVGARTMRKLVEQARPGVHAAKYLPVPQDWDPNRITAAWLGHSTVLLNFYGVTILTDPVLFKRIGANTRLGTIGLKRLVAAPLHPAELPEIDLVLLSHAHMDHLDPASLRALSGQAQTITAKETTDLLPRNRAGAAHELTWGEQKLIKTSHGEVHVSAFEVRHWGARWRYDTFRGYNGYLLAREDKRVLFGGDTAYIESFRRLKKEGRIELAIMPVGAYDPHIQSHCNPEEAVRMADFAGAEYFAPVHFKTFPLGHEGPAAPLDRLGLALETGRLTWSDVGQTSCVA